jgi:predicted porin
MRLGLIAVSVLVVGVAAAASGQEKSSWSDSIKLKGDARFRFQNTDEEGKDSRERWRFRGRVGVDAKVNDTVKAELRLVTNVGDPISDNITMGGIGNPFDDPRAALDRVNFAWTPVEFLTMRFGKMGQPWIAVDDLVMSVDANPEGIAANGKLELGALGLNVHGGAFVIQERKAAEETMLYTAQAAAKFKLGEKNYVMAGGTVYSYENVEGFEPLGDNNNTTVTVGDDEVMANEFMIVEAFAEVGLTLGVPLTFKAQYMVNTEADDNDTGYLGSASVKLPAGFSAGYQYRYVEKDATYGALAESTDFGNGGVDIEGHIPYVRYQISKNFDVKAQYAMGQKGVDDGKDIETFKIDLACKF